MATTPNVPRPVRPLAVLAALLVVMYGIMALTGSWKPNLGLDLQGGTSITLTASTADGGAPSEQSMEQAVEIIRNRVDAVGATEAEVSIQGRDNIVVQVPGVGEDELIRLVGQTAELRFRPVLSIAPGGAPTPAPTETPTDGSTPAPTTTPEASPTPSVAPSGRVGGEALAAGTTPSPSASPSPSESPTPGATDAAPTPAPTAVQPEGDGSGTATPEQLEALNSFDCAQLAPGTIDDPDKPLVTCDEEGANRYLLDAADVIGTNITDAFATIPQSRVDWVVAIEFDGEGADAFADSTERLAAQTYPQNSFAIVLDGRVVSAPTVEQTIPNGEATIEGNFSQGEAQDLANVLKYGALPLTFTTSEVTTVSATLGADQLQAGLLAGAVGLALVVIYSLLFYRALGIVSIASLAVAAALTYASVVLLGEAIGFALILAGVIGVIVAIGITADSFVVFFERVRDEIREGRTIRMAVELGWTRAKRTILIADFVTLLAAGVLYFMAIGRVQNFAFTLGLTTVIDLVVVFLFTKPMVTLLVRRKFFGQGHRWSGLDPELVGRKKSASRPVKEMARAGKGGAR